MGLKNSRSIKKSENIQSNISSCDFIEIIVAEDFEVKNGVLGLNRDVYLSIVKFLDSLTVRKVFVDILFFALLFFFLSILELVKNHMNK
jgi:hypothetical protein